MMAGGMNGVRGGETTKRRLWVPLGSPFLRHFATKTSVRVFVKCFVFEAIFLGVCIGALAPPAGQLPRVKAHPKHSKCAGFHKITFGKKSHSCNFQTSFWHHFCNMLSSGRPFGITFATCYFRLPFLASSETPHLLFVLQRSGHRK